MQSCLGSGALELWGLAPMAAVWALGLWSSGDQRKPLIFLEQPAFSHVQQSPPEQHALNLHSPDPLHGPRRWKDVNLRSCSGVTAMIKASDKWLVKRSTPHVNHHHLANGGQIGGRLSGRLALLGSCLASSVTRPRAAGNLAACHKRLASRGSPPRWALEARASHQRVGVGR